MLEEEIKENKDIGAGKIPVIRTFKGDSSRYIKEKKVSLIGFAAKQEKSGIGLRNEPAPSPKKYIIAFLLILFAASALSAAAWFIFSKKPISETNIAPVASNKPIIVAEDEQEIVVAFGTRIDQSRRIKNAIYGSSKFLLNKFLYFPIVVLVGDQKIPVKTEEFFNLLKIDPPSGFIRSLDDRFMLAKFQSDENFPILILKINSYERAFAGMMVWEKNMAKDFEKISRFNGMELNNTFFRDKELKNKDTRVLENADGKTILVYSFINREFLIIATSQTALEEIFRRFSLPQYLNG